MIQDLHTHTYYSYCGKDAPDKVIKTAIENGIEFLGISDHCHGAMVNLPIITYNDEVRQGYVNQLALNRYYDHIKSVAYKYRDYITVWCGVEVATVEHGFGTVPNKNIDLSFFDYCFIENLDHPKSTVEDMFAFAKRTGCKICGIPHMDLPAYIRSKNENLIDFFKKMAENNIFWELNVNYDSSHGYKEHEYVKKFFGDEELINAVRESGLVLSVGFDGHKIEEYQSERVKESCRKLEELKIPMVKY